LLRPRIRPHNAARANERECGADQAIAARKSRNKRPRSAITSGRQLFISGDAKWRWSRRFHDLILGHVADLDGAGLLSEAQFSLIRRAAALRA
jgi:hypothetical protein